MHDSQNQLQQRVQHAMSSADDEDYDSQEGSGNEQNSNGDHDAEASGLRLSGKKRRREEVDEQEVEEEGDVQEAVVADGKPLCAAESARDRRFLVRFAKLRAHKRRRALHAVISVYPGGKLLFNGDLALLNVLHEQKLKAPLQRAAAVLHEGHRTFRSNATNFADAALNHNQRQAFAALMCSKLRANGDQGNFPSKTPAGEPAEEPAEEAAEEATEKPADWAKQLRGPKGERLGLVVPFQQPAFITSKALCLEASGSSSSRGLLLQMPMLCDALATWAGVVLEEEDLAGLPACAPP